ncbi:threonine/serine exporter family protein [Brachybacterium sp. EF45031]|uniref:threonine/serine ThrE exporter family protein n=1 Tax=Brachybacterium sillae TaxID=2810536 RepID=UPI00217D4413|nr:threonine/serine exporter family protein [Brachybacterium sillae]MCS6711267.1 threonine/serine exporter family protein [Brachybacterium sillae]
MPTDLERLNSVFDLAQRIGVGMLGAGAAASEVSATVLRVVSASGIRSVAVQVTFDEVSLSYHPEGATTPITRMRLSGPRVQDFARLAEYEVITERYIDGGVSLEAASEEVRRIARRGRIYPLWLITMGLALMGGGAALGFGAGSLVVIVATLSAGVLNLVIEYLLRWGIPLFYAQVASGLVGALGAVVAHSIDPSVNSSIVVVACIIIVLSGLTSIGAVQDAVTGWYITASARVLETIMLTVGLVIGVRTGIVAANALGADIAVTAQIPLSLSSVLVVTVSGLLVGLGYGVGTQVPARLLAHTALVAAGSSVIAHLASSVLDRLAAVGVASMAVGVISVIAARRVHAPALIFAMVGLIPLVPGSRIYRGLLAVGDDVITGVTELFAAAEIAIVIAAGAVFGQLVASRLLRPTSRAAAAFTPVIAAPFSTLRRRRLVDRPKRRRRRATATLEPSTMTGEMAAVAPHLLDLASSGDPTQPEGKEGQR